MKRLLSVGVILFVAILLCSVSFIPVINAQISKTAIKEAYENKKQIINTNLESLIDSPFLYFLYQLIATITAYFLFGVWGLGLVFFSNLVYGKLGEIISVILNFFRDNNLFPRIIDIIDKHRGDLLWVWFIGFGFIVFGVAMILGTTHNLLFGEEALGINTGLQNNNHDVPLSNVILLNHGDRI